MKKKLLLTLFLCLTLCFCALMLNACDKEDDHVHTFIDIDYDEDFHWQICSECGKQDSKHAHIYNDKVCSVCGYYFYESQGLSFKLNT